MLAKVADLIENHPYCVWHRPPDNTELEARVRQLAQEEIDAAGYAEENHSHSEYAEIYHDH